MGLFRRRVPEVVWMREVSPGVYRESAPPPILVDLLAASARAAAASTSVVFWRGDSAGKSAHWSATPDDFGSPWPAPERAYEDAADTSSCAAACCRQGSTTAGES